MTLLLIVLGGSVGAGLLITALERRARQRTEEFRPRLCAQVKAVMNLPTLRGKP